MERYEGIRKIRSEEEYEATRKRLEEYLVQYKWITESDAPLDDIFDSLLECSKIRKLYEGRTGTDEREIVSEMTEKENEYRILSLKRQFDELKHGTYIANLRRNITALYITVGEYEARAEKAERSAPESDSVEGHEEKKREYITSGPYRRARFFWAAFTGLVPGEILNMDIEDKNEIPLFIKQKYGLISLIEPTPFENNKTNTNTALVVAPERNDFSIRWFANPVNKFIASRGIVEMNSAIENMVDEYDKIDFVEESSENKIAPKNRKKGGKNVKRSDRSEREDFGRGDER